MLSRGNVVNNARDRGERGVDISTDRSIQNLLQKNELPVARIERVCSLDDA